MLRNRLLSIGVLLFAAGVSVAVYLDGYKALLLTAVIIILCLLLCAVYFLRFKISKRLIVLLCLAPAAGMLFTSVYSVAFIDSYNKYDGIYVSLEGQVSDINSYFDGWGLDVRVTENDAGIPGNTKIRIYPGDLPDDISYGDHISGSFYLNTVKSNSLKAKSIRMTGYGDIEKIKSSDSFLYNLKNDIINNTNDNLPGKSAQLVKAITVADRTGISTETFSMFSSLGISHILAVSGLHLSVLVMTIYSILSFFGANKYLKSIVCIILIILMCSITGFTPSIMRSGIMLIIFMSAQMLFLSSDSATSLFTALGLLLFINPFSLSSLSLQLSFLSTLGILAVSGPASRLRSRHRAVNLVTGMVVLPVIYSLSSALFTIPVMLISFDKISIISPLVNIIVPFLFTPLLMCSYLFIITCPFTAVFSYPVIFLSDILESVCSNINKFDLTCISTSAPFLGLAAVFSLVAVFAVLILKKKSAMVFSAAGIILIAGTIVISINTVNEFNKNNMVFETVQRYDSSAVFISGGSKPVLIDLYGTHLNDKIVYKNNFTSLDKYIMGEYNGTSVDRVSYMAAIFNVKQFIYPNRKTLMKAGLRTQYPHYLPKAALR